MRIQAESMKDVLDRRIVVVRNNDKRRRLKCMERNATSLNKTLTCNSDVVAECIRCDQEASASVALSV